jgi:hypothetical protein
VRHRPLGTKVTPLTILLKDYKSEKMDRNYQFWKRDRLAIPISTETILIQKLDYIHFNPTVVEISQIPRGL